MIVFFRCCGLLALAGIVYSTLAPASLRPHVMPADLERFLAFLLLGTLLSLGYPRRTVWLLLLTAAVAVGLELAQLIDPTRDGRVVDAAIKVVGGSAGVVAGALLNTLFRRQPAGTAS